MSEREVNSPNNADNSTTAADSELCPTAALLPIKIQPAKVHIVTPLTVKTMPETKTAIVEHTKE